ncbi:39S ribosomal protein L51, mitochondrial-like [Acanthaster planci]|uniref:Large ribosomal subunit protein mL51 n=1 Tax=Acanthaster planci TaxID=133434 RepID=A0A8B7Z743_ACAPL|nr:39S ribosomal protein L51, mitochondrial-like [Acanthaster planci]
MPVLSSTLLVLKRSFHFSGIVRIISQGVATYSTKPRPPTESLIQWNKLPIPKKPQKDRWDEKHALFGENDYKDILGDGSYELKRNIKHGPRWLHGWRGNELQRLIRKNKIMGADMGPTKRHAMLKRIKYLHKKLNRNKGKWMYRDKMERNYRDEM